MPFLERDRRLCLVERGTERAGGVVKSRPGRSVRDAERFGDRHEGQAHVVVEDEDGPLVERELAECPLQLVAIVDRSNVVREVGLVNRQLADRGSPAPVPRPFRVTGVDEDPEGPPIEAAGPRRFGNLRQMVNRAFWRTVPGRLGSGREGRGDPERGSPGLGTRAA